MLRSIQTLLDSILNILSDCSMHQTRETDRTSAGSVVISSLEGASYPLFSWKDYTSPHAISISDLLSRHVNKCHAGDKPPTTTTPARRKGHHGLSSTRATTSKQACDQCVINTLPCDGAFPCCEFHHRSLLSPQPFVRSHFLSASASPALSSFLFLPTTHLPLSKVPPPSTPFLFVFPRVTTTPIATPFDVCPCPCDVPC